MPGQEPTHSLNLGERFYRRVQRQSLRRDQQVIMFYYMMRMRIINYMGTETALCATLIFLSLTLHFYSPNLTDIFGFLTVRLLVWLCFASILGTSLLIILHLTRFCILSDRIRRAWEELNSRQLEYLKRHPVANCNLVSYSNTLSTARKVRHLLRELGRDLASPESKSKYESILPSQTEMSLPSCSPEGQNVSLSQPGNSRTSRIYARHSRYHEFNSFISALSEVNRCGQEETIRESQKLLVDKYTVELIRKINEYLNGIWFQISNPEEFYIFIKDNWNDWFPQRAT